MLIAKTVYKDLDKTNRPTNIMSYGIKTIFIMNKKTV